MERPLDIRLRSMDFTLKLPDFLVKIPVGTHMLVHVEVGRCARVQEYVWKGLGQGGAGWDGME